jgi:ABC-2 type transport system ATP-binding protein
MSKNEIAVSVREVNKSFRLPHEQTSGIKQLIVNFFKRKKGYENQHVLKDISFDIKKGEFFGIVGRNGSGKSTLLKLLAGIYSPDKGMIQINGTLTPFIELGVGFNPELTGRENVFLNGALLGFSRKEMEAMYDDIVSFAELSRFMDQKLKNYSSGMQVRLAFSIAIKADSQILVLDEVLAVGDAAFQQKCFEYFEDLKAKKRTIILVTHDMSAVKQFCDRALLLKSGKVESIGEPSVIATSYENENYKSQEDKKDSGTVDVILNNNKANASFSYGQEISVDISWSKSNKKVGIVGVVIYKGTEAVFATNTIGQDVDLSKKRASLLLSQNLGPGRYKISATIFGKTRTKVYEVSNQLSFSILSDAGMGGYDDEWQGIAHINNKWINR